MRPFARFVVLWLLAGPVLAFDPAKDMPPQARPYLSTLGAQVRDVMPGFAQPEYFGALIEHESGCPSLPKMCWSPTARLRTAREEGAGFGQITRAYGATGVLRFDALAETRALDPRGLNELRWDTVYQRPDLQLRAIVVKTRQNWNRLAPLNAQAPDAGLLLRLVDIAYNAGAGRATSDLRACALQRGCDPGRWAGNVQTVCTASRAPIYGQRSACDIYHAHVADVVDTRMPKYRGLI